MGICITRSTSTSTSTRDVGFFAPPNWMLDGLVHFGDDEKWHGMNKSNLRMVSSVKAKQVKGMMAMGPPSLPSS